jgi:hypothetical protein
VRVLPLAQLQRAAVGQFQVQRAVLQALQQAQPLRAAAGRQSVGAETEVVVVFMVSGLMKA